MRKTTILKQILARRSAAIVPGAANAMFARAIEDVGYEAVYVTGAGVSNMRLGLPDLGLMTLTEIADTAASITGSVSVPVIVDADTGFGNAVNVIRTVQVLERTGVAGIQIEDQIFPKKCGHFERKQVIPLDEMVQKIKAAVDTRHDNDLQIIARTDAAAVEGLDSAIERALAFVEAGADATFVEAPKSIKELARIPAEVHVGQIANIVFGGKTPDPGREELGRMGYAIVLYANATLQAALKATYEVLRSLKHTGSLADTSDLLASFDERQRVIGKEAWDAFEEKYRGGGGSL